MDNNTKEYLKNKLLNIQKGMSEGKPISGNPHIRLTTTEQNAIADLAGIMAIIVNDIETSDECDYCDECLCPRSR